LQDELTVYSCYKTRAPQDGEVVPIYTYMISEVEERVITVWRQEMTNTKAKGSVGHVEMNTTKDILVIQGVFPHRVTKDSR
jgi:hypothetical protein